MPLPSSGRRIKGFVWKVGKVALVNRGQQSYSWMNPPVLMTLKPKLAVSVWQWLLWWSAVERRNVFYPLCMPQRASIFLLQIELWRQRRWLKNKNNHKAEILASILPLPENGRQSEEAALERKIRLASGSLGNEERDDGEFRASLGCSGPAWAIQWGFVWNTHIHTQREGERERKGKKLYIYAF